MLYVGRNTVAPNNVINTSIEQVQSDYAQVDTTAVDYIKNKPTLASVATSGDYSDLSNTPTIPTVNDATLTITQNGTSIGTFTANASSDVTVNLTDTTYTSFVGADGSTAGSSGLVPAPTALDNEKFLKGDGTWATVGGNSYTAGTGINITNNEISVASPTLTNKSTGNYSLNIDGFSHSNYDRSVNIGKDSYTTSYNSVALGAYANAGQHSTALGYGTAASGTRTIAIGSQASTSSTSSNAMQFGKGTNDESNTVKFGDGTNNWKLLDLATGYIPIDRLDMDTTPTQSSTKPITSGAVYAALGDIETVLDAIIAQGSNA